MLRSFMVFCLFITLTMAAFAQDIPQENVELETYSLTENGAFETELLEARATEIFREIKCPICTTQSVAESDAEISKSLRVHIRNEIIAGKTNDEIYDAMARSYGDAILLRPRVKASTLPLWFAPWIFVLLGFLIWRRVHIRQKKTQSS